MTLFSVKWKLHCLYVSKASVDIVMYDVGALPEPWLIPYNGLSVVPPKASDDSPKAVRSQKFIVCSATSMRTIGFLGTTNDWRARLHRA